MLVETAFISNPDEEKRLRNSGYQNKLADHLLEGIIDYFEDYPPPGTRFAREPGQQRTDDLGALPPGGGAPFAEVARRFDVDFSAVRLTEATDLPGMGGPGPAPDG
jgi:N-acetylmuramoyl-L-alanine amidase